MTLNLGTVVPGRTILVPFNAFSSDDPSASVIISDFVLADIGIYEGTNMTERGSTTGVVLLDTDGINIDGATGIHGFTIDLSSNATDDFYVAGSRYYVTVGPITIDGATVNFLAATFEIGYPGAILDGQIATLASQTSFTITNPPTSDSALVGCSVIIHEQDSATEFCIGYVSAYTTAANTVTLKADPAIFTIAAGDNVSFFMPANVQAVAGTTQTAGDIIGVVDAIKLETDKLTLGDAGAGTAGSIIEEIENRPTTAMRGTDNAGLASVVGALDDSAAADDVTTADTLMQYLKQLINLLIGSAGVGTNPSAAVPANGVNIFEILNSFQARLPAALVNSRMDSSLDGTGFEAAAVDLVWDEVRSGHETQNTFGEQMASVLSGNAETGTLSTTVMTSDVTEVTNDHFIGRTIIWMSGVLKHQATDITDYSGTNGTFTYTATTEAPANGDNFIIV